MSRLAKAYFILWGAYLVLAVLSLSFLESIKELIGVVLFVLTIYYAAKVGRSLARKLLWRIRRKLILSYIFIGFIPICLLLVLFLLGFAIFMGQATSEMFYSNLEGYVFHAKIEAEKLLHLTEFLKPEPAVERWITELQSEDHPWMEFAEITLATPSGNQLLTGKALHEFPEWVKDKEFSGVVMREGLPWIAAVHHDASSGRSINFLVPVSKPLLDLIRKKTNADIHYLPFNQGQSAQNELKETLATTRKQPIWPVWWDFPVWWLSLPDQYDWETGKQIKILQVTQDSENTSPFLVIDDQNKNAAAERASRIGAFWVSTNVSRVYNHIFARSTSLQKFVYVLMIAVAIFFLIIELISLISGFLLARSITASVHNLFEGTEKIKSGDFSYRIKVTAQDQLGELAASFNNMTESIQNLLVERSEKERLAESLRIARQMQQKLLPQEIPTASAMEIATLNLPAQEVCGDYYDIIQKNQNETGVIIADVSGKGPSAALYMAEVKGVMLSLSRRTIVPKEVLLEANGILGPTLDSRNFITMTYALIDDAARTMRISRAGHNPILHYCAATGAIDVVQPSGIGLGMGKNGIFEKALEEVERSLGAGDILVFYTDGLTEAMNDQNQLFGLPRLSQIILFHKDQGTEEIKNAVLTDLQQFLNHKSPQDDITLVLLKMR